MIINIDYPPLLIYNVREKTKFDYLNEHISKDKTDHFVRECDSRRAMKEDHCGRNIYDKTRFERTQKVERDLSRK